jgi:hypothetical protein
MLQKTFKTSLLFSPLSSVKDPQVLNQTFTGARKKAIAEENQNIQMQSTQANYKLIKNNNNPKAGH